MRLPVLALLATACGPAPVPGGTVELRFSASDQVKSSPNLKEPPLGTVYGNIFLSEDVAVNGPRPGSIEFGPIELAGVDLRTEKVSVQTLISPKLPPGKYVFLGFLDVDGNGSAVHDPDPGDPVTLALTNKFDITDGAQTRRVILFELVLN